MPEATGDRLARLLAIVSYLADHDRVTVADLATHFGVSEAQVLRDVDTLWVSGTPGYQPDDLLDFSFDLYEEGVIALTNARGMDRKLRLEPSEAVALLVALRAMRAQPGMSSPALDSALAKLTVAAGDAALAEDAVRVDSADTPLADHVANVLAILREAIATQARVRIRYASASDEVTERLVEPHELTSDGNHWYLRAWCLRAAAIRHFRLDRVLEANATTQPRSTPTSAATSIRPVGGERVRLTLTPRSRWVAERFGGTVTDSTPQQIVVDLDIADVAWLDRLVLELGGDVLGLDPPHYAAGIAERARRALTQYDDGR